MPATVRKLYGAYTVRVSKVVDAPPKYVYEWCTDFRGDDGRFSKSKPRFRVLRPGKDRVVRVRTSNPRAKDFGVSVELVRLSPPNAWHVDQIDEGDLATVDYRVTRLGARRSRVALRITERWMIPEFPGRDAYRASVSAYWDALMAALEARYRSRRPARG